MLDISGADEMDKDILETVVSVHSPLIQCSSKGNCYTSYAISLKSDNPCFTYPHSHLRRRYSEFAHLRSLLSSQHPSIVAPTLPPKSYFSRFNHVFIEERKKGLQVFLEAIINTPVYLSNKSVHLFLQSSFTMEEIDRQVTGDVPAPKLLNSETTSQVFHSDSSSTSSSESSESHRPKRRVEKTDSHRLSKDSDAQSSLNDSPVKSKPESKAIPITCNLRKKTLKHSGSCDSVDSGTSSLDSGHSRRVSFNDKVTVAVVCNHLWNYGVKPIKAGA